MSAVSEVNRFSNNILNIYKETPDAIRIIFEYNLLNKINISIADQNGNNLLHLVAKNNDNKLLANILNYISYVNPNKSMINHQNNIGDTPMHIATRNGNDSGAKMLHSAGASLNIKNNAGEIIEDSESNPTKSAPERKRCADPRDLENLMYNEFGVSVHSSMGRVLSPSKQDSDKLLASLRRNIETTNNNPSSSNNPSRVVRVVLTGGNQTEDTEDELTLKLISITQNGGHTYNSNYNQLQGGSVESDKLHTEVIEFFQKMTGDEEDARALKAALYSLVKEKFPDINGLQRAEKMVEYTKEKKIVAEIKNKLGEFKEIIKNAKKAKENRDSSRDAEKPEKKPRAKKAKADE